MSQLLERPPSPTDLLGRRLREIYDNASFEGDDTALSRGAREVIAAEAQIALARGRFLHAEYLNDHVDRPKELTFFTDATRGFESIEDRRGEAEATFWVAAYHQVVLGDDETARELLERAHQLADEVGDLLVQSYVVRHLGFADLNAGQPDQAEERFELSLRLRRQIGFDAGVAAALLPLADIAMGKGDRTTAEGLLAEAEAICRNHRLNGVRQWVAQLRERHHLPGVT